MVLISFIASLLVFVTIGVFSVLKNKHNNADYLLAGSSVPPWLVALSAVATNNSGYMFIGLIGYTYVSGLQAMWLMIGWIIGDFIASFFVHQRLREKTEETGSLSYGGLLADWFGQHYKILRFLCGILTLLFLATYAAAQLNAGSKALFTLLGWSYQSGAIIGAVIFVIYCFAGGIRASIWTDAAQSFVMVFAMATLLILSIHSLGGIEQTVEDLKTVSDSYLNIFPENLAFGPAFFLFGWMAAGLGVVGQPHIMVRFMTMRRPEDMPRVRLYYYSWFSIFSALCVITGLVARLIVPFESGMDTELAMPMLALEVLPPVLVGLMLAGLFSATISTADSQVLSCTASLSRDLTGGKKLSYWFTKLSTIGITALALFIALYGGESVFNLVVLSWAALAAAFVPLLILLIAGEKPSQMACILVMLVGVVTVILWHDSSYSASVYSVLPGMVAGFLSYAVIKAILFFIGKYAKS